jgi:hypothetical protein
MKTYIPMGLAVFLLASGLYCTRPAEETPPPLKKLPPGTTTGKTYENSALKFKFSVPPNWKFVSTQNKARVLAAAMKDAKDFNVKDMVTVRLEEGFGKGSVMDKLDNKIKKIQHFFKNYHVIRKEGIVISGTKGGVLVSSFSGTLEPGQGQDVKRLYLIVHQGHDITFDFIEPAPDDQDLKKDIEFIINSIKLY